MLSTVVAFPLGAQGYKTPGGWSVNGDQEILADPARTIIYRSHPLGDELLFLDAFTGNEISRLQVGLYPMSIDLSPDGYWLYVATSGSNQTTVVNATSRTIARTIPLDFSPFSARAGPNDRLYISGAQDGIVRILNATTGLVLAEMAPMPAPLQWLLEASPDGAYILVHLLTSGQVRIAKYGVSGDQFVFLAGDNSDLGENFMQMAVDWAAGVAYLVSGTPYGIEMVSLATLARLGWLQMSAYPGGVALIRDRHVVIGISRNFYDADLWAFDTTTRTQVAKVPIAVSPGSGYVSEESLIVASEIAGTVLLWTEGDLRVLTVDPSVTPGNPAPDSEIVGLPAFYVTARLWRGLVEPPSNTTTLSLDGTTLSGIYDAFYNEVRAVAPVLPVGRHRVTAEIAWQGGSKSVTWNFTVTSPPAVASFVVLGPNPLLAGVPIDFDASPSEALGTIITFDWDFGEGSTASGARATHTFGAPGIYRVSVTITTNLNVSDTLARQLVIETASGTTQTPPWYPLAIAAIGGSLAAGLAGGLAFVLLRTRRRSGSAQGPRLESRR